MSLLPEPDDRVPGKARARADNSWRHRSVAHHAVRFGVAAGLALTTVAAVAPHAAAAPAGSRANDGGEAVTLTATESSRDELPHSGDGTLPVMLAGAGSLAIGGLALWLGGRTKTSRTNGTRRATG